MLELNVTQEYNNIFLYPKTSEAACVTTNGMTKFNGDAVMGAGIALYVNQKYHVADLLGKYLKEYGNRVFNLGLYPNMTNGEKFRLFSFPTKDNWKDNSKVELIEKSARELVEVCNKFGVTKCYLPPVGCTNGRLSYKKDVKPILVNILDDRFICVINRNFVK